MSKADIPPCHNIPATLRRIAQEAADEKVVGAIVVSRLSNGNVAVYVLGSGMDFRDSCELLSDGFKAAMQLSYDEDE